MEGFLVVVEVAVGGEQRIEIPGWLAGAEQLTRQGWDALGAHGG